MLNKFYCTYTNLLHALSPHRRRCTQTDTTPSQNQQPPKLTGEWQGMLCVSTQEQPPIHQLCYEEIINFRETASRYTATVSSRRIDALTRGPIAGHITPATSNFQSPVKQDDQEVTLWMNRGRSFWVNLAASAPGTLTHTSYFSHWLPGRVFNLKCWMHLKKKPSSEEIR
ncbi:hypothetical protein [Parendozoicomonas haliclonae]|uniref:Uncharacterized protein n=1 Tax=Parendozoicomonas haliclonae TaxID=1960125 RepID=A0A1X7AH38_9GAMM|nr:hypothetical protein [Parendozoicomonas haliclonae]SMA41846.1 hypothetical protein EHSB41UT_01342 [Parendozoicomonas haliclonae]